MKHSDNTLNALRLLAMGAVGFYLYKTYKKEGTLGNVMPNTRIDIDTDKLSDMVMPFVNLPEPQRQMIHKGLREALANMKRKGLK